MMLNMNGAKMWAKRIKRAIDIEGVGLGVCRECLAGSLGYASWHELENGDYDTPREQPAMSPRIEEMAQRWDFHAGDMLDVINETAPPKKEI